MYLNQLWDNGSKSPVYFNYQDVDTLTKNFPNAQCKFFFTNMEYGSIWHNGFPRNTFLIKKFARQEFQNMTVDDVGRMIKEYRILVWIKINKKQALCVAGKIFDMMQLVSCEHFGILKEGKTISLDSKTDGREYMLFNCKLYDSLIRNYFGKMMTDVVKPNLIQTSLVNGIWQVFVNSQESLTQMQQHLDEGRQLPIPGPAEVVHVSKNNVNLSRIDRLVYVQNLLNTQPYEESKKSEEEGKRDEEEFERENKFTVVGDKKPKTMDADDYFLLTHGVVNISTAAVTYGSVCCAIF